MFHAGKVLSELEAKRDHFTQAELIQRRGLDALEEALETLTRLDLSEVQARLAGIDWPGAHPTEEHTTYQSIIVPFAEQWANHREARQWALKVLQSVPTFAVDGSQITPSRDISIPIAVVQAGWFENRHTSDGAYEKDIAVEVLAPGELAGDEADGGVFPDWMVNWRRFEMEVERLITYMEDRAHDEPKPLCFFDGSLVISFVQHIRPERQERYTDAVVRLLNISEDAGVPVVGYVDTSYANDLTVMLGHTTHVKLGGRVSDAGLLRRRMNWGDRTQAYICGRDDAVLEKYYEQVCFVYLKTTSGNPPARIDFPRWLYEAGEHDRVLDLIRAECIVGNGYPYALETADAVAVLTMQDRERFYRLVQEFTEREGLPLRFSRKMVSKQKRRVL